MNEGEAEFASHQKATVLCDLDDARAALPDLQFCMGSKEASIFEEMQFSSKNGEVDLKEFKAALGTLLDRPQEKSRPTLRGVSDEIEHRTSKINLSFPKRESSSARDPRLACLLRRMDHNLPLALEELERTGRKSGHWAWWAWPTEKEGFSEPGTPTAVTEGTAPDLLRLAPQIWQQVLIKICTLIEDNGGCFDGVIPRIDWGRIAHFVAFFDKVPESPDWLSKQVLPTLKKACKKASKRGRIGIL